MAALDQVFAGPGEWIGVRGERVLTVLPPQAAELAARVWVSLDAGAGFDDALDVVLRSGLGSVPSVVVVESLGEARLRLLLRGTPTATLRTSHGAETLAHESGTWLEVDVVDVDGLEIELGGGGAAVSSEEFGHGLRRIGSLVWGAVSEEEPEPVLHEEPVVVLPDPEPEPEPELEVEPERETAPLVAEPFLHSVPDTEEPAIGPRVVGVEASPVVPAVAPAVAPVIAPVVAPAPVPLAPDPAWQSDVTSHLAPVPETSDGNSEDATATEVVPARSPGTAPVTKVQPVARITFSHGLVVDLDRPHVVGRAPSVRPGESDARTVTVPSPLGEVSATHVEVRPGTGPDTGRVVVTDLGSTNGTVVLRQGEVPVDLLPGIPLVLSGQAVVDLGDGATLTVLPA